MFERISKEDIDYIESQLQRRSGKDSQLPVATGFTLNDQVAIIQDGKNKLISLAYISGNFDYLSSGYIPYVSSNGLLNDSPLVYDGVDIKIGTDVVWNAGNLTKLSQLLNDPEFITLAALSDYATQSWVSTNFNNYTLPTASADTLGGIKVGNNLSISDSILSAVIPSSIPASDVYSWAKAENKPNYSLSELSDDSSHRLVTDIEKNIWNSKQNAGDYALNSDLLTALSLKVDKVANKGLSSNDLTDSLLGNLNTAYNVSHTQNTDYQLITPDKNKVVAYTDNSGKFHIDGDIVQEGSSYITHAEEIRTSNDYIKLRDGATSGLAAGAYTGLEAYLYDGSNYGRLAFDRFGIARVGDVGSEQPLATREETPINGYLAKWNSTTLRFETVSDSTLGISDTTKTYLTNNYLSLTGGTISGNLNLTGALTTVGIESSKGGVFFGQYSTLPTNLGTYVANYVSSVYGARVLAYDGAAYQALNLGSMPATGTFGLSLLANGNSYFGYNVGIGTNSPVSQLTQKSTAALESAPLGAELLTSSNWTIPSDWSGSFSAGFTHAAGSTGTLSNSLAAVVGNLYQITITISNRTAGSITISFGGQSISYSSSNAFGPKATSTASLSIVSTSDFNGTVVLSIKQITGSYNPIYSLLDSTNVGCLDIRSSLASSYNTFIGCNAGKYNTTGYSNSALGCYSLRNNTTGSSNSALGCYSLSNNTTGYSNSAVGYSSLSNNTTGYSNSALGCYSLSNNTTGYNNSALGAYSLSNNTTGYNNSALGAYSLSNNTTGYQNSALGAYSLSNNTTGYQNSALGISSLYNNTTGYQNSALGYNAGRNIADGLTSNTNSSQSLFLGVDTRPLANNQTNQIVIGNGAIGNGSNTVTLGNDNIVSTFLKGNVYIGLNIIYHAGNLTKLSQLNNDTGFITLASVPTKISQLNNDSGYITSSSIPTKLSQFANDTGFITSSALSGYALQSWVNSYFLTLAGGTITGSLAVNGEITGGELSVSQTSGVGNGISLYNSHLYVNSHPMYGLMFAKTSNFSTHGGVTGDWATYFTMDGSGATRGWVFKYYNSSTSVDTNVASIDGSGNFVCNGNITTTISSDKRLKKNIKDFSAMSVLKSLGGIYSFDYNDKAKEINPLQVGKSYGFIAQNLLHTDLKDLVRENNGYYGINYNSSKLIALSMKGLLEHETEIDKLKRENKALKLRVAKLERRAYVN